MDNNKGNQENNEIVSSLILELLSILLQLKNLQLNEQQVKELNDHLQSQDTDYLQTIIKQNEIIQKQNEEIIKLLRGR